MQESGNLSADPYERVVHRVIYALDVIELTLIYVVMIILNFAHGEFLMLGMYVALWMFTLFGLDPYLPIPIAAILIFALGAIIQRGLVESVLDSHPLNQIILLLVVLTLMIGLVQFSWTAQPRLNQVPYETEAFVFQNLRFSIPRSAAFVSAMISLLLLYLFLNYTRTGAAIRPVSPNRDDARLMGINVKFFCLLTVGLGAAVTGIGGAMLMPIYRLIPTVGQPFAVRRL